MEVEDILKKLVSIDSVFGNEQAIGLYLESYLKKLGFKTKRQYFTDNRFNIFAQRGKGKSAVLFYGHMDTVTSHGGWKEEQFKLSQQGDKLYGLGSCDMKGGISAMLKSVEENSGKKVKILLCSDEENISEGAWSAIKEKDWFRDVAFIVSCEPGDSKKYTGGANIVTVGRRGRTVIQAEVYGISSHGANPQRGINAIDEASKIALSVKTFRLRKHKKLGKENIFIRKITGHSESALDLPDKVHIEFDIQLVPPSTTADAKIRIEEMIKKLYGKGGLNNGTKVKVSIKHRETPYIHPYIDDLSDPKIKKVLKIIKENLRKPIINYGSSVADDNILANALHKPIVTIGPSGGNEHAPKEWVSKKSLTELVKIYILITKEM